MSVTLKLFSVLLILCFANQAFGEQCGTSGIVVNQSKTGAIIEGNPEYNVTVSNNCGCPQSQVIVKCFGLSSVEPVDTNAIKVIDGERCIVNSGNPISQESPINFKYAWLSPQDFPVISTFTGPCA